MIAQKEMDMVLSAIKLIFKCLGKASIQAARQVCCAVGGMLTLWITLYVPDTDQPWQQGDFREKPDSKVLLGNPEVLLICSIYRIHFWCTDFILSPVLFFLFSEVDYFLWPDVVFLHVEQACWTGGSHRCQVMWHKVKQE